MSSPLERRQVTYSGHVQGVGFRYTAREIARHFDVSGFVRNLPDGRVELVAEGTPEELTRFLADVSGRLGDHIRGVAVDQRAANQEFTGFEIRH